MRKRKLLLMASIIIFSLASFCYALETDTHEIINENIAKNSFNGFSLDVYLKNNLGIQGGVEESFNSQKVWWWLRKGGFYEDIPAWYLQYIRSLNHFHNPITEEGFKGDCLQSSLCVSSTVWALMPLGTQSSLTGNYSWYDVRDYYLKALTSADKTTRDTNFAQTFRGVGQLMHLIQDASVPAHTRDDGHLFYNYEDYAKSYVKTYGVPLPTTSHFFTGTISNIASFIDTNKYNGTNPAGTVSNTVGLSEYTNANFFSEDTIFIEPYPAWSSVVEYDETIDVTTGEERTYLKKIGDGETIQHLATARWFYRYLPTEYKRLGLELDDNVYQDYASLLLPRAVGYSASLLNYFFRGQLAVVPVDSNNVKIQNLSKDALNSGTIELYYDNTQNERIWLTTYNITTPIAQGQTTDTIYFIPPTDNKTPGRYWAVFNGKLGEEEGAVIGAFGYSWTEEWDRGLFGNHPWYTTMNDPTVTIPYGSAILAEVSNGILIQENMRPAGTTSSNQNWQLNVTRVGVDPYGSTAYMDAFPLPVTSDTEVRVKIDLINTNFTIPLPQCIYTNVNGAYQHILIVFNQTFSDGTTYIAFTVSGQQYNTTDAFRPVFITSGVEARINIYQELQRRGVTFTEPLQINRLSITQQFLPPCETTIADQQQLMQVDYIRIIDGVTQQ